jgi:hypothetical protein
VGADVRLNSFYACAQDRVSGHLHNYFTLVKERKSASKYRNKQGPALMSKRRVTQRGIDPFIREMRQGVNSEEENLEVSRADHSGRRSKA